MHLYFLTIIPFYFIPAHCLPTNAPSTTPSALSADADADYQQWKARKALNDAKNPVPLKSSGRALSLADETARYSNFKRNRDFVTAFHQKSLRGLVRYNVTLNDMADLNRTQFAKTKLGYRRNTKLVRRYQNHTRTKANNFPVARSLFQNGQQQWQVTAVFSGSWNRPDQRGGASGSPSASGNRPDQQWGASGSPSASWNRPGQQWGASGSPSASWNRPDQQWGASGFQSGSWNRWDEQSHRRRHRSTTPDDGLTTTWDYDYYTEWLTGSTDSWETTTEENYEDETTTEENYEDETTTEEETPAARRTTAAWRPTTPSRTTPRRDTSTSSDGSYVKSLDWRDFHVIPPVKTQGDCGSCWAFSSIGAMEGRLAVKTGAILQLSEQNLVDCSTENSGCDGGDQQVAFEYVKGARGVNTGAAYRYVGEDQTCRFNSAANARYAALTEYYAVRRGDVASMMEALQSGPIAASLDVEGDGFMLYSGGIYDDESECENDSPNHAVLIVGYGVDSKTQQPYWLVRNSWGEDWGEGGYARILRGHNTCGIEGDVSYPVL